MKYNYKYGKLNADTLTYAPNKLVIDSEQVFNASADTYKAQGYLPIVKTEEPEGAENYYYMSYYTEESGKIVQQWEKVEIPVEATESDYINAFKELGVSFDE